MKGRPETDYSFMLSSQLVAQKWHNMLKDNAEAGKKATELINCETTNSLDCGLSAPFVSSLFLCNLLASCLDIVSYLLCLHAFSVFSSKQFYK